MAMLRREQQGERHVGKKMLVLPALGYTVLAITGVCVCVQVRTCAHVCVYTCDYMYQHMLGTVAIMQEEVLREGHNEEGIKGLCTSNEDQLMKTCHDSHNSVH